MIMDAISAQYGWSDEEILDLYLCRVNQIRDSIYIRQYNEMIIRHREIEWQTKTISAFVIAVGNGDLKGKQKLQSWLEKISLSDTNVDTEFDADASTERSLEDIIENGSVAEALDRNAGKSLSTLFQV